MTVESLTVTLSLIETMQPADMMAVLPLCAWQETPPRDGIVLRGPGSAMLSAGQNRFRQSCATKWISNSRDLKQNFRLSAALSDTVGSEIYIR